MRITCNSFVLNFKNLMRIFLTRCQKGSLTFVSTCDSATYCGEKQLTGGYIFQSCSNTLNIKYISSSGYDEFRGFNLFYEVTIPGI
jgi:hypothetical protein